MKIYLVGGAVRDQLMGIPVKEKDWVVVGATVADMLQAGFRQVGKDFPVFLHPETGEEYALARTERKIGRGYTGFEFNIAPSVTLEEDLTRRDITINAIAKTADDQMIDPYHGQEDLAKGVLRHVSAAFAEDPVRILRIARFAARFGFQVAAETLELMRQMVREGEVDALVAERVWKELVRALLEQYPDNFFVVLKACGALPILFPHLETPSEGISALLKATQHSFDGRVRFAALFHGFAPMELEKLCGRYRVPREYQILGTLVVKYLPQYQRADELNAEELLGLFQGVDAFRRATRFMDFLHACEVSSPRSFSSWFLAGYHVASAVDIKAVVASGLDGRAIADKIREKRYTLLKKWLQESSSP